MSGFFALLGKLVGFAGQGSTAWGQGLALLPYLSQIMMLVQAIKGQGTGVEKRQLAIDLFNKALEAESLVAKPMTPELKAALDTAIGECIDAAIALDKVVQVIKA